MTGEEDY